VAALVLGILGIVIVALPMAVIGLRRTKNGARPGRSYAVAGLSLTAAWVVLAGLTLLGVLFPVPDGAASAGSPPVDPTSQRSAPSTSEGAVQRQRLTFDKLRTGHCIETVPDGDTVTLPVVPCELAHDEEVLGIADLGGGPWPGVEAIDSRSEQECRRQFTAFVGIAFDNSSLDVDWYTPAEYGWRHGDHAVLCAVYDPAGKTTGTLKGGKR